MDKKQIEILFIALAAFGTLALVYFAYKSNSDGGDNITVSYPIVRSAPVDQVGLANAQANVRASELAASTSAFQSLVNLVLGKDTNKTNLAITEVNANAQIEISENESETLQYQALQQSQALISAARFQFEAVRQQEKSKRHGSVWNTIGNLASSIIKLF